MISGCVEKECETDADCLSKTCFTAECTDNKCVYVPLNGKQPGCSEDVTCGGETCKEGVCEVEYEKNCCGNEICEPGETYENCSDDCPNCDDVNECTKDSYDYHEQKCVNTIIPNVICCGNGVCEIGETYSNCAQDCPNCDDDNNCTVDSYDYHEQKCINEPIIPCCGNGICDEDAETYSSCPKDCPDCDDDNKITTDSFNYETQKCENVVIPHFIDGFEEDTDNPSSWSRDWPDYMTWDTEQVHSGSRSLKTDLSNVQLEWYIWRSNFIPVKANQNYHLKGWIKTENADHGAEVGVHFFDASHKDIGHRGSGDLLSGTNDWTFRELTFVTAPGTEYIQIMNSLYGINGIAWFDDITLIEETD